MINYHIFNVESQTHYEKGLVKFVLFENIAIAKRKSRYKKLKIIIITTT